VTVLLVIAVWEAAARMQFVPKLFLPSFTAAMRQLWLGIVDTTLLRDLSLSLMRAFGGLALALLIGVVLGVAMARNRIVNWLFDPLIALGFPSPSIAFLPVFVVWFGIDSLSKVLLVAFACVFPIVIGSYNAARGISRVLIWSGYSMGASPFVMLVRVILPACGPRIFAAMRVALPVALITTFTAEMVAGGGGMGATLMYSQRFFESPTVFAYIVVMLAVGLLLDSVLLQIQKRVPAARG